MTWRDLYTSLYLDERPDDDGPDILIRLAQGESIPLEVQHVKKRPNGILDIWTCPDCVNIKILKIDASSTSPGFEITCKTVDVLPAGFKHGEYRLHFSDGHICSGLETMLSEENDVIIDDELEGWEKQEISAGEKCVVQTNTLGDKPWQGTAYKVSINHHWTLDEMVQAGDYDFDTDTITEAGFQIGNLDGQKDEYEVFLVHILDRRTSRNEVLRQIDQLGLRPVPIEVLLALGEQHPKLQLDFSIVGLGSSVVFPGPDGGCYVPCLWADGLDRGLRLDRCENGWNEFSCFAAIRK